jgi:acetoin utilization deacetylase AcuC-like enzyme
VHDPRLPLGFHASYTDAIHPDARFPRERYRLVAARVATDAADRVRIVEAPLASRAELVSVHDEGYVDALLAGTLDRDAQRRIGLRPWTDGIVERVLRLVGGSVTALDHALATGSYAGNLAGGTHHAFRAEGAGYCFVNDVAILARRALDHHGLHRVAIVDLDVHQGDGTAALLADEPRAFTFSMHGARNFPLRKQRSDLDVELPDGTTDDAYLAALDRHLPFALHPTPDLVIFQAGVDALAEDALGRLSLTRAGMAARNRRVFDACDALGVPCVILMGGGYGRPIEATVEAFVDLFAEAGARALARTGGRDSPTSRVAEPRSA